MSIGICVGDYGETQQIAVLYDDSTGTGFGPVFTSRDSDAFEQAQHFLEYIDNDARTYDAEALRGLYETWHEEFLCPDCGVFLTDEPDDAAHRSACRETKKAGEESIQ